MTTLLGRHAGVIGGSMAGMLAARVLADHFERVTVFERDRYPGTPAPRRGVPQGRHIHFVLTRGREELERFFPTLAGDLVSSGAVSFDYGAGASICFSGGWLPRFESTMLVRSCTRPLLDASVLRALRTLPNVEIVEQADVTGLFMRGGDVAGLELRRDGVIEKFPLDFVVDAAGRQSNVSRWLDAAGFGSPAESVVDPRMRYVCCLMEPPSPDRRDWKLLSMMPRLHDQPRSAAIIEVEGGQWMAAVATYGEHVELKTVEAVVDFSRTLPTPLIHEALRAARPTSPVFGSGGTMSRWLRFDRMPRLPDRLAILGDSVCALNPVYGQGVTLAAIGARLLDDELRRRADAAESKRWNGFARTLQAQLAKELSIAWMLSAGSDVLWPRTTITGDPGLRLRIMRSAGSAVMPFVLHRFLRVIARDPSAARRLIEVMQLKRSPNAAISPRTMFHLARELVTAPWSDA